MAEKTTEEFNKQLVTNPTLPPGGAFEPINQVPNEEELIKGEQIDPTAVKTDAATATAPDTTQANTVQATTIGDQTPQGEAAQGVVSDSAQVVAAQQEGVSKTYEDFYQQTLTDLQEAATVDPKATVQYQYSQLMDFGPDEVPAWAKGALTKAQEGLAARGLGGSSIAAEGITAALMQAALPIASQDAKVFETMGLAYLDKRMQAAFLKAGYIAQMDMANLNNRQQANVINAQSFLAMDMSNLSNRQQTAVINVQARLQTMLSDQAATNAADQFNASSQNQIDMFYSNLTAQIETFNASQLNTVEMFNSEMVDMREQFNVKNALLVEQANAQYLRDINTQNTAMQNQANYLNSQNLLEISNTAFANEIQLLRDKEAFAFDMSENEKDRILNRYLENLRIGANKDLADDQTDFYVGTAIGDFTSQILGSVLANWADDEEGT